MNTFENLPIELFYEIFDYLPSLEVFETFSNLNQRFYDLLFTANYLLKINFTDKSKNEFNECCQKILTKTSNQTVYLRFSHQSSLDAFSNRFTFDSFTHIQSLNVSLLNSERCQVFLHQIRSLPSLNSLTMTIVYIDVPIRIFDLIAHILPLKYAKIVLNRVASECFIELSHLEWQSSIQYLEIICEYSLVHLLNILTYFPSLKSLTCYSIHQHLQPNESIIPTPILPIRLTFLCLEIRSLPFDIFLVFMSKISHFLRELSITVYQNTNYLNADRWETLIKETMPNLVTFDFQSLSISHSTDGEEHEAYHQQTIGFASEFWKEKNWSFAHLCCPKWNGAFFNFFSQLSNRRERIHLNGLRNEFLCVYRDDQIVTTDRWFSTDRFTFEEKSPMICPFAHDLSFQETFTGQWSHGMSEELIRFIHLHQITNINLQNTTLNCLDFIELLRRAPHLENLTIQSITRNSFGKYAATERTVHRYITKHCRIQHICIRSPCTRELIEFLVRFCPSLYSFDCQVSHMNAFGEILTYLLLNCQKYKYRYLALKHPATDGNLANRIDKWFRSRPEITDYSIILNAHTLYVWF